MKGHYIFISHFIFLFLVLDSSTVDAQCDGTFHTYTNLCDLNTVILEAEPLGGQSPFSYIWSTGETTQQILIPNQINDYLVTITDANGCTVIVFCHVKHWPEPAIIPNTDNACEGDSVYFYIYWIRDELPGLLYEWSTGESTDTIIVTDDITWSLTVTDPATGCELSFGPATIDFDDRPEPEIVGPTSLCNGGPITLNVEGGPFDYYEWYPTFSIEDYLVVTAPGTYWVNVFNVNNVFCAGTDTVMIEEGIIESPLVEGPAELCSGQSGVVSLINYQVYVTYIWNNGETTHSFQASQPGTYTVTVTDASECMATESITIEAAPVNDLFANVTPASCGFSNGNIELTYSLPGNYSFNWSNGATSQNLENVPSGIYSVTVTDDDGCFSTLEVEIPEEGLSIVINESISHNTSCSNYNGAISLLIIPNENYNITWSNGNTSDEITGLAPGSYSVTVSYGATCEQVETYFVEDSSAAPNLQYEVTSSSCGESNGAIDLQLSGGTSPFTYLWSNGSTSEDITGIGAGDYSVTVTAADGCLAVTQINVPNSGSPINIEANIQPNTSCSGYNGSISLSIIPAGNYDISWSNGSTSEDITGLAPGSYTVTVSYGMTCEQMETYFVDDSSAAPDLQYVVTPPSCGESNGAIDLQLSGGTSPFTYLWSNGETEEDITGIEAGEYAVTVTAADGCNAVTLINVQNNVIPINIEATIQPNTSCISPNGNIDITIDPPGSYTILWSTGAMTEDISNLGAGMYIVNISEGGCTTADTFVIMNENLPFTVSSLASPNTSCNSFNGAIDLTISPGGNYSYLWSSGMNVEDLQYLAGGQYTVTVTDVNGCSISSTITVENISTPFFITGLSIANTSCLIHNGSIDISVSPPNMSFTYLWSTGAITEDIKDLSPGSYSVTVTNIEGCSQDSSFAVNDQSASFTLTVVSTPDTSCSNPSGSLDLSIVPAGSYSFNWTTGATTEDIESLSSGTYSVTVSDNSSSCTSTAVFEIENNTILPVISFVVTHERCDGNDGEINISVTPQDVSYSWSNGSTTEDLTNLAAGIYQLTVTASNGCRLQDTFYIIDENSHLTIAGMTTDNISCISGNGAIDLTVTPNGAYAYQWSNGQSATDLQSLPAGNYTVTVTDQYLCEYVETFIIYDNPVVPQIIPTITPATCGQSNGSIDVTVAMSSIHTFLWSTNQSSEDLLFVNAGVYGLTVTSDEGCSAEIVVEIPDQNTNFSISSIVTDNNSCSIPSGSIHITIEPEGLYSFQWSTGATTEDLLSISSGNYTLTVTDQFNCTSSETFTLEDLAVHPLLTYVADNALCGKHNGKIQLIVSPESTLNQFLWSTGDKEKDLENLNKGSYSVTVTDENGCTAETTVEILGSEPLLPVINADLLSVPQGEVIHCSLTLNVPLSSIDSISWLPYDILSCHELLCLQQNISISAPTEVFVMVTDTNGCKGQAFLSLDIENDYQLFIPNIIRPHGDGNNRMFTIFANESVEEVVRLEIFDRWGNCVFINESFPPNLTSLGWNGSFKGETMNPAVFVYHAVIRFSNGKEHRYVGDITLVR